MNNYYEKKYLKYKLKYLELSKNNIQLGGSNDNEILTFSINNDSSYLLECGQHVIIENITYESKPENPNYKLLENHNILSKCVGTVLSHKQGELVLIDVMTTGGEFITKIKFNKENFYIAKITLKKFKHHIYGLVNSRDDLPNNILYLNKQNYNDKDNHLIPLPMSEPIKENNLEKSIEYLHIRLNILENKLNNHYHDIPTTGMRTYTNQHPFYKEVDDHT